MWISVAITRPRRITAVSVSGGDLPAEDQCVVHVDVDLRGVPTADLDMG